MNAALLERPVGKKLDTSIRIDAETADVIRKAATLKDMTIGEYVRAAFLPIALRDMQAEAAKITKAAMKPPKP